jgi:hypothetical protein
VFRETSSADLPLADAVPVRTGVREARHVSAVDGSTSGAVWSIEDRGLHLTATGHFGDLRNPRAYDLVAIVNRLLPSRWASASLRHCGGWDVWKAILDFYTDVGGDTKKLLDAIGPKGVGLPLDKQIENYRKLDSYNNEGGDAALRDLGGKWLTLLTTGLTQDPTGQALDTHRRPTSAQDLAQDQDRARYAAHGVGRDQGRRPGVSESDGEEKVDLSRRSRREIVGLRRPTGGFASLSHPTP